MSRVANTLQYFVPPYIFKQAIANGDHRFRNRAIRSLTIRARLEGRREILGRVNLASPLGEKFRAVFDAKEGIRLPGTLARIEGQAPANDDKINAVYENLGIFYDFFFEVFGRNSIDNRGLWLIATLHFDTDFNNAFWDGRQVVYGDGDGLLFQGVSKSLGVLAHELSHGVIQYASGLGLHDEAGALAESWADVFASLVKQYHDKQSVSDAGWLIGQNILGPGLKGHAVRSVKEPGTAFDDPILGRDPQVSHFRNFVKTNEGRGGVHINSGIPNRAFYLVAQQLGGYAWEDAGRIWYEALHRFHRETDFAGAATATAQVAGELFGQGSDQQQAVISAWNEVGVRAQVRGVARRRASRPTTIGEPGFSRGAGSQSNGHSKPSPDDIHVIRQTLETLRQRVDGLAPASA